MRKDIIKAMEIEQTYLHHKLIGEKTFNLIDEIQKYGFESLEEYFDAKKTYQLSKLEFTVKNINPDEVVDELKIVFENNTTGLWLCDHPKTYVFGGINGLENYNENYCIENNITVYPYLSGGGIIVHQDGDFTYGLSCPANLNIDANYILKRTSEILQKYTDKKVTVNGNDILVDMLKVSGSTSYKQNGLFLILVYFSFNDKTKLINNICNKKSDKIPGYIDFITREELKQEVLKWLHCI